MLGLVSAKSIANFSRTEGAGTKIMRRFVIGLFIFTTAIFGCGSIPVLAASDMPVELTAKRTLSDNPLWAMPLAQFSETRARPIFSQSRRPAPAVAPPIVAPKRVEVPKPKPPERPQLSLVGTVTSDTEGIGIFLDQSSKSAIRLKIGEDFHGWKLRTVQGRETTLEKDGQIVTLEMPQPSVEQVSSPAPPPPVVQRM
jgi:hypothetical protein